MKNAILDYIEPVYRFCLKRLSSQQDAEDLAQEILISIIESSKQQHITYFEGYVWRIAHNRYARKIEQRHRENVVLCGDDYLFDVQDDTHFNDEPSSSDEYSAVFYALHTLSAMYRDILVDYYVHELNVSKIAEKYGVSNETIKWRLHTGRERMKERLPNMNKTYEKVKMHVMCNGSFSSNQYLCNQIYKAVAMACYESPITIEEISMATGIPTLYLEETLEFMIYGDAIEKVGNKYQTDFIIVHDTDNKKMQEKLQPTVGLIASRVWENIERKLNEIRQIGFYGSEFDIKKLGYILVPEIIRGTSNKIKQNNPLLAPHVRPARKDGGNGWFIVTEGIERIDENFSGCNTYVYTNDDGKEKARTTYFWLGDSFDEDLNKLLKNYQKHAEKINFETGEFISDNEEEIAELISYNLIEKQSGKYYSSIPMLKQEHVDKIITVLSPCYDDIIKVMETWMVSLLKVFESFTPKRLHDQILGNVDCYSFNATAFVIKELQRAGKIMIPRTNDVLTSNLFYVKR